MKTAIQELRNDILIEMQLGIIGEHSGNRVLHYIDTLYLEKEKEQTIDLINFIRLSDKMGKRNKDLYNEYYETI